MHELQILDDELDVADGPFPQFDLAPEPAFLAEIILDLRLHRADRFADLVGGRLVDVLCGPAKEVVPQCQVTRDDSGLEQRLFFPEAGVLREVLQVAVDRRDEFARPAPGTQPHVDAVHEPRRRDPGERLDQFLPDTPVGGRVVLGQEEQVDVGTVVEFLPAEFSHRNDAETFFGRIGVGTGVGQAGAGEGVSQQGELGRHPFEVEQAEEIAEPDAQQLPALEAAQGVKLQLGIGDSEHRSLGLDVELLNALEIGEPFLLHQPVEIPRIGEEDVGEELAADEQPDENLDAPGIGSECLPEGLPVGDIMGEPLEVEQCVVGLGRVGKTDQQRGDNDLQQVGRGRGGEQLSQPIGGRGHIAEARRGETFFEARRVEGWESRIATGNRLSALGCHHDGVPGLTRRESRRLKKQWGGKRTGGHPTWDAAASRRASCRSDSTIIRASSRSDTRGCQPSCRRALLASP